MVEGGEGRRPSFRQGGVVAAIKTRSMRDKAAAIREGWRVVSRLVAAVSSSDRAQARAAHVMEYAVPRRSYRPAF